MDKGKVKISNCGAQKISAPMQSKNSYGGKKTSGKDLRVKK